MFNENSFGDLMLCEMFQSDWCVNTCVFTDAGLWLFTDGSNLDIFCASGSSSTVKEC